jgi:phosphoglycolate phosphatase-like HAD superfamily hydrolase
MKYLIFDFDGVLGDTYEAGIEASQISDNLTREHVIEGKKQYFEKSTHTRDLNLSKEVLDEMQEKVSRYGNVLHNIGFDLFVDFVNELKSISDAKMAVVSSGPSVYIKPRLEKSGLTFTHILTFEDHHSKEDKVEQICKDWGIDVKDAYFFTDSLSDVRELQNIMDKNNIYGCAWGYQGKEKLKEELDEKHILVAFSDIQKIWI